MTPEYQNSNPSQAPALPHLQSFAHRYALMAADMRNVTPEQVTGCQQDLQALMTSLQVPQPLHGQMLSGLAAQLASMKPFYAPHLVPLPANAAAGYSTRKAG